MLTLHDRPMINEGEVIAKIMDGEAILINLSNGLYYSMDDTAALVWAMIERRYSLEAMVDWIAKHFHIERQRANDDVMHLVQELLDERLVVVDVGIDGSPTNVPLPTSTPGTYNAPQLIKYTDMGDLLALDPPMPSLPSAPWRGGASGTGR